MGPDWLRGSVASESAEVNCARSCAVTQVIMSSMSTECEAELCAGMGENRGAVEVVVDREAGSASPVVSRGRLTQ